MKLAHFVGIHGLTRASKLTDYPVSTIQSWIKSGKDYNIGEKDGGFKVYVWK